MKKKLFKALAIALVAGVALTGCGGGEKAKDPAEMTYAVEAGSAGESVAMEMELKYNSVGSQADALMEVDAGTSDAAIID